MRYSPYSLIKIIANRHILKYIFFKLISAQPKIKGRDMLSKKQRNRQADINTNEKEAKSNFQIKGENNKEFWEKFNEITSHLTQWENAKNKNAQIKPKCLRMISLFERASRQPNSESTEDLIRQASQIMPTILTPCQASASGAYNIRDFTKAYYYCSMAILMHNTFAKFQDKTFDLIPLYYFKVQSLLKIPMHEKIREHQNEIVHYIDMIRLMKGVHAYKLDVLSNFCENIEKNQRIEKLEKLSEQDLRKLQEFYFVSFFYYLISNYKNKNLAEGEEIENDLISLLNIFNHSQKEVIFNNIQNLIHRIQNDLAIKKQNLSQGEQEQGIEQLHFAQASLKKIFKPNDMNNTPTQKKKKKKKKKKKLTDSMPTSSNELDQDIEDIFEEVTISKHVNLSTQEHPFPFFYPEGMDPWTQLLNYNYGIFYFIGNRPQNYYGFLDIHDNSTNSEQEVFPGRIKELHPVNYGAATQSYPQGIPNPQYINFVLLDIYPENYEKRKAEEKLYSSTFTSIEKIDGNLNSNQDAKNSSRCSLLNSSIFSNKKLPTILETDECDPPHPALNIK